MTACSDRFRSRRRLVLRFARPSDIIMLRIYAEKRIVCICNKMCNQLRIVIIAPVLLRDANRE